MAENSTGSEAIDLDVRFQRPSMLESVGLAEEKSKALTIGSVLPKAPIRPVPARSARR